LFEELCHSSVETEIKKTVSAPNKKKTTKPTCSQ